MVEVSMYLTYLRSSNNRRWLVWLGAALLMGGIALFASGCQGTAAPTAAPPTNSGGPVSQPGSNGSSEVAPVTAPEKLTDDVARATWQESRHAQTYVARASGQNSDCARCHAPVEWIPTMDDLPESCFTCKFEVAPPPPVISMEKWSHVDCKVCHKVDKKGTRTPGAAWLEIAAIGEYSTVESNTQLCMKCHQGADVSGHVGVVLSGVHADMVCTDCHDPHGTTATCGSSACHEDVFSGAVAGHDADHASIACMVCHDGGGWELGKAETGEWVTLVEIDAGGEKTSRARTSHNLVTQVDCAACHYPGNPWDLTVEEE
jgi:hypothetical protein